MEPLWLQQILQNCIAPNTLRKSRIAKQHVAQQGPDLSLCVHGRLSLCSSRLAPLMCVNNLNRHPALQELGLAASHRQAPDLHTLPTGRLFYPGLCEGGSG